MTKLIVLPAKTHNRMLDSAIAPHPFSVLGEGSQFEAYLIFPVFGHRMRRLKHGMREGD